MYFLFFRFNLFLDERFDESLDLYDAGSEVGECVDGIGINESSLLVNGSLARDSLQLRERHCEDSIAVSDPGLQVDDLL
jgi:microcompartment protein CcmK/EutM